MSAAAALPKGAWRGGISSLAPKPTCEGCDHELGQFRLKHPITKRKGRTVIRGRHTLMLVNGRWQAPLLCPRCRRIANGIGKEEA